MSGKPQNSSYYKQSRSNVHKLQIDPDGDSQMHSSPASSDEDDTEAMFPSANEPPSFTSYPIHTHPAFDDNPAFDLSSELSPPNSQDPQQDAGWDQSGNVMDLTGSQDGPVENGNSAHASGEGNLKRAFVTSAEEIHKPGAAWDNKRARDEYGRAWQTVEDKEFSLSRLDAASFV